MRVDPIQASVPDLAQGPAKVDVLSSTPERQLQQPEADISVLAAVKVESEQQLKNRSQKHSEVSYDERGKAVVRIINDDSGETILQVPSEQVLEVSEQIEKEIEERALDLRS